MMEDAINLANEMTATHAQRHSHSQSPPQSPTGSEKMEYPAEPSLEHTPSLISKLKNSIRRSPKTERKRTFSDDRPPKGDAEEELSLGAQEAYNVLVVRGSERPGGRDDPEAGAERVSVSSDAVFGDAASAELPGAQAPSAAASSGFPPTRAPSSKGSSGLPQPPPRPMPKPRLDSSSSSKKSELPIPKPRPEIVQRVEPTIRRPPDSPEAPVKEKESHIPVPASRRENPSETKERQREQLKRTIEIVRMESPARDEGSFAGPGPGSGPDHDTKDSTPEPDSDSTRRSSTSEGGGGGGGDSSSKVTSLFDDDFSEPSPREIMSKLARESRMRRNLDHQRVLSGENQDSPAASITRTRREPTGIPVKAASASASASASAAGGGSEEAEKEEEEEVDTNPLRMLRGGAIPIRSSRGAGNSPAKSSAASALRYPKFGFQSAGGCGGGSKSGGEAGGGGPSSSSEAAPKLPPRAQSVSGDGEGGALPPPRRGGDGEAAPSLPPRTPLRQLSMPVLNSRPRERRNPLVYSETSGCDPSAPPHPLSRSDSSSTHTPPPPPSPSPSPPLHHTSLPPAGSYSASFDACSSSSALSSRPSPAFLRSVSLHDEPCPPDLPQAPSRPRPRPHPLSLPPQPAPAPAPTPLGLEASARSDLASHHYYGVDESELDSSSDDVFLSSRRSLPPAPASPPATHRTPPRLARGGVRVGGDGGGGGGPKFAPDSVQCSLEQLGFFNQHDPFWVQSVRLPEGTPSHDSTYSSEEVSPLLLVSYKNSDNVSYEDLLDFGLDR